MLSTLLNNVMNVGSLVFLRHKDHILGIYIVLMCIHGIVTWVCVDDCTNNVITFNIHNHVYMRYSLQEIVKIE